MANVDGICVKRGADCQVKPWQAASSHKLEPCSICCMEMTESPEVIQIYCGHKFHKGCLKPWLERKEECPMCKHGATLGCMRKAGVAPYDTMLMFD